ncbi:hypothetical protein [Rhizobium sp. MHM7A]|uniref:hypothetical protein n=1 Tax=Rhizobium sp. MHM7A TaxID=2583233 RepID=UPI001107047F|nr:hypothetical protein [Rhizobium sp. MHM7A]TLX16036.1 hypothetical protein FFR93_01580 [Rhizobium sp. MHM7A]
MKFSINPEQDDASASVAVTSPLLDVFDTSFSYKIGTGFTDPLANLLRSQRHGTSKNAWARAAVWLAAEIECASQVDLHKGEISSVIAETYEVSRLRDGRRELLELKERAKRADTSPRDKHKALSDAAMTQRALNEIETSAVRFSDYIDNILSLKDRIGNFDFGNSLKPFENAATEFQSTYGPVHILNIGSQRLAVSPGGVKGGKTILTERGRVFVNCEVSYANDVLSIDTGWRRNIAGFRPDEGFDDEYLTPIVLNIVQQYLAKEPDLEVALRRNSALMSRAEAWAREVLNERLKFWLREEAAKKAHWNKHNVKIANASFYVTPRPGDCYEVEISSLEPIRIGKETVRAYGSKANVYDLGDGQFGVAWPHLSFNKRYFAPENDTTRHFREMVSTATEQVAGLDSGRLRKSDQVFTYCRVRIDKDCAAGLSNLGLTEKVEEIENALRSLSTNELLLPPGATKEGPVTLAEADLSVTQRIEIKHQLEIRKLEHRYGLPLAELEHNYFKLRETRLDLPGCLAVMTTHLGMKPTSDFSKFETDIRAIRQMLLPVSDPNRLIDDTRARQLRSDFRKAAGPKKVAATADSKKPRREVGRPTKKSHAQAMAKRLEKLARETGGK